jgi:hypothetical protein
MLCAFHVACIFCTYTTLDFTFSSCHYTFKERGGVINRRIGFLVGDGNRQFLRVEAVETAFDGLWIWLGLGFGSGVQKGGGMFDISEMYMAI